jgi:AraC-like DNA-binding protein
MHSVHTPRRLFGDWNQSALWAADWVTEEGEVEGPTLSGAPLARPDFGATNGLRSRIQSGMAPSEGNRLLLPPDQVVCLLPVGEPLHWSFGSEVEGGRVEPGHAVWLSTGPRGVWLGFDGGCDALLVGMRRDALADWLEAFRPGLAPAVRELLFGEGVQARVPAPAPVAGQIVPSFRKPPVQGAARAFWYESQVKALLALLCFLPAKGADEFFCSRQKRLARLRVAKAKTKLESRLDEPFDLNRLAAEVGCSASYLSRTFSATTGMTISHYLRKKRIERAAELLLSGRYNVSEVAVEVGYHSLSHFSKAFQVVKGCLPSKFEAA